MLGPGSVPLGRVTVGVGNDHHVDGAVTGRVVGTYLHGPVLPRNPPWPTPCSAGWWARSIRCRCRWPTACTRERLAVAAAARAETETDRRPEAGPACWRIQVCMAMPEATPALIDRVEPYWLIEQTRVTAARAADRQARALLAEDQHAPLRELDRLEGDRAGQVVDADQGRGPRPRPTCTRSSMVGWWRMCWYRSVTMAPRRFHLRRPTMCTSAAPKALALRTTVPMFMSWLQFSMATWNGCRRRVEVGHDGLVRPVAVAVDHVAPVAVAQQLGVEAGVVGPRPRVGPDPDLLG